MKKLLLLASVLFLATQANAQGINFDDLDDLTPYNYVFDNLTDGDLYPIGGKVNGWWPSHDWPTLTADNQFEGFVGINNGSNVNISDAYAAATSIYDMGEGIGNVLCIKGPECPDDILPGAPKLDLSIGNWNCDALMYAFCTSNNPNDEKPNVIKLVMKVMGKDLNPDWGISAEQKFRIYEHTTGDLGAGVVSEDIKFADTGTAADEWLEMVFKYNHNELPDPKTGKVGAPTEALILNLSPGSLKTTAFVIKEVSFYKDPTFTDKKGTVSKRIIKIVPSGVHSTMNDSKISYTLNHGKITLNNLKAGAKINVYSLSGMLMKQLKSEGTTATFSLDKGYYTVNVDGQNIKVLN